MGVTGTACMTLADTAWSGWVSDVMDDVSMTGTVVFAGNASCAANQGENGNRHTAAKNDVHLMAKPSDFVLVGPRTGKSGKRESPAEAFGIPLILKIGVDGRFIPVTEILLSGNKQAVRRSLRRYGVFCGMKWPRAGAAQQFEQLAVPHFTALYRAARSLSDAQTADDLVQETYLRAWKYFDSFDPTTNCRAWLFRILRNAWTDRWRKNRLIPLSETDAGAIEAYYDWEDEFLKAEFSERVGNALAELPAEYRWSVLLADVEEFSYQEIAGILSCPIGTVMSRINRGRRMLARLIRSCQQEQPRPQFRGKDADV